MSFLEIVRRAKAYLEEQRRVSLRALKREFDLDDDDLEELVDELVVIQRVAVRDEGALAWRDELPGVTGLGVRTGSADASPSSQPLTPNPLSYTPKHLADRILQSRSALEGERKQVTVLFADVKGSMELAEELDPEEWHRILDRFFQILSEGVHRFEGTVNQYTGDGIMALFGAPIAHEDHAQRACYAALHLRDGLRGYADELRVERGVSFSVRMGLNSGEVIVGKIGDDLRMDYTAQGRTVGLAARMEQLAEPGKILVTEDTAKLATGYVRLRDLGPAKVKGTRQALHLFELEGIGEIRTRLDVSRARGLSGFVGREKEMGRLDDALAPCRERRGRIVGLVGDAGLGKSRLCHEFVRRCRAQGVVVHEAQAVAHGKLVPFLPMLDLLRACIGIEARESAQTARNKVAGALALLDAKLLSALPLVLDLLGVPGPGTPAAHLDPDARQQQILAVLPRLLLDTTVGPTILLLEDLHWLDGGSEALLAALVDAVPESNTLLLVNFRPEYRAKWMADAAYEEVRLQPLGDELTRDLLRHLLGSDSSLANLTERIAQRALGNPFFIEEIVRDLVESEKLSGDRGAYRLVAPSEGVEVPPGVQSILAARIDRLPDAHKKVLQTAAVIGRRFSGELLGQTLAGEGPGDMHEALASLVRAELIDEESLHPTVEYAFVHPLTQEVAYGSQLGERRRLIHAAVARAIERALPDCLDEQAALIAYHWDSAGDALRAARWFARAGERMAVRSPAEGLRHFRRVRELLEPLAESEGRDHLLAEASQQVVYLGSYEGIAEEEAGRCFQDGLAACQRHDDIPGSVALHVRYAFFLGGSGDMRRSLEKSREAIRIADESGDAISSLIARSGVLYCVLQAGQLAATLQLADECLAHLDPIDSVPVRAGNDPVVVVQTFRGWALAHMGRLAAAQESLERALTRATRSENTTFVALCHAALTDVAATQGRIDRMGEHARKTYDVGLQIGSPRMRNLGLLHWGRYLLLRGQPREALTHLEELHTSLEEDVVTREAEAANLCWLARAQAESGDVTKGLATAKRSVEAGEKNGTLFFEAVARLERARTLINFVPGAGQDIAQELSRAESLVDETGGESIRPFVRIEQARLARLRGDHGVFESLLVESRRLLLEAEATEQVEYVDELLAQTIEKEHLHKVAPKR
jgi:class 3 adenylate cyclase/tetratricopeptide (TPR) repeat protein